MPKPNGPRRQVLARRVKAKPARLNEDVDHGLFKTLQQKSPSLLPNVVSSLKARPVHTESRPLHAPAPVSGDNDVQTANLHIHSSCKPYLLENEEYTITAKQEINYTDSTGSHSASQSNLTLTKDFVTSGSKSALDESLIHSVYPPSGHSDFWNTLPHVLFTDPETPWLFETPFKAGDPWLALFVFTHDELYLSGDTVSQIAQTVRPPITPTPSNPLNQTTTFALPMTNDQFTSLQRTSSAPLGAGKEWGSAQTQAIFIPQDLYQAMMPRNQQNSPWLMSHVRSVDTAGMTDMDASDSGTYAVTVAQRTGPVNPSIPTAVFAHLVVIPGLDDSGKTSVIANHIGLCSLYSWSYTCLPTTGFSLTKCLQDLGKSVQPLRLPNQNLNDASSDVAIWVMNRLKAGYSLGRYRPLTGEVTMCLFRGMLMPDSPYSEDDTLPNVSSSDFGSDLAIIDNDSGLIDVTYHMAWTLGRSMATADRSFCAALTRVRNVIHNQSLKTTKLRLDKISPAPVHKPIDDTLKYLSNMSGSLQNMGRGQGASNFKSRWKKPATRPSTRDIYSFAHDEVKDEYKKAHRISAFNVALTGSPDPQQPKDTIYDETSPPASTDWAIIFAWALDKWHLGGIPMLNLIPDPSFVPKESIRTFYIDPSWLKSFFDGAFSVAVHHTDHDDTRDAIKDAFQAYLSSNVTGSEHPPQMPRFGIFLRSEMIQKFPNLHISAPFPSNSQNQQQVEDILRLETIDQDLLVILFDRIPGTSEFQDGITIQPPGHQLSFTFGNAGWTFSEKSNIVTEDWRNVIVPQYNSYPQNLISQGQASNQYTSTTTSAAAKGFDFQYNTLLPADLGLDAQHATGIGDANGPLSSILGAQLIASYPKLQILDAPVATISKPLQTNLPRLGWTCVVDSEEAPLDVGSNVFDSDQISHWHTEWQSESPDHPHTMDIDMKQTYNAGGLTYLPRQDNCLNGNIGQYAIYGLSNGNWNLLVQGTWDDDISLKTTTWTAAPLRYIRLKALTEAGNRGPWTSAAEINVLGAPQGPLPFHSLQTSKRSPNQKYPSLPNQDTRPIVPPPPSPPTPSPITAPTYTNPPKLLSLLADSVISNVDDRNRYMVSPNGTTQVPKSNPGCVANPSYIYNIYTLVSSIGQKTYSVVHPNIPGYPLDLHCSIQYQDTQAPDPNRIIERLEILLPYGPQTSSAILAPLPTYSPSSNPITSAGDLNDPSVDAPHKNTMSGVPIPRVRYLGKGQRYSIRTSLVGPNDVINTQGQLLITLEPLMTPVAQAAFLEKVSWNKDLSFRVEGVALNGGTLNVPNPLKVTATEYYTTWRQDQGVNNQPATDGRCEISLNINSYMYESTY